MDQRESMIQLALADLESGKYPSIRQAAKAYNVSRSTLANRQHSKPTRSVAHEQQQRLTPAQEEFLTEWIFEQDLQGYAPSHTRVREMAARILRMDGDAEPLGKAWVHKYMQRNLRVIELSSYAKLCGLPNFRPTPLEWFAPNSQFIQLLPP
jgi:hypothetical protein